MERTMEQTGDQTQGQQSDAAATGPAGDPAAADSGRGNVKERVGKVLSSTMDKTVVVAIPALINHPIYNKTLRRTKKLYAHDESNRCNVGDTVRVIETRPLSRTKRWRVSAILERAK
jgi:small subunit ribosomal protein S17